MKIEFNDALRVHILGIWIYLTLENVLNNVIHHHIKVEELYY